MRDYACRAWRASASTLSPPPTSWRVLLPIWSTKRVTAGRVRQRIGAVMKWAVAQGYRDDNQRATPSPRRCPRLRCASSTCARSPTPRSGAALQRVKGSGAYRGTVLAFEFLVLTAARSGEGAKRPVGSTSTARGGVDDPGRAHEGGPRAPGAACAPGAQGARRRPRSSSTDRRSCSPRPPGGVLNHAALTDLLHGLGIDAVPHGFRSSFRDWAAGVHRRAARGVRACACARQLRSRGSGLPWRSDLFDRRGMLTE